MADAWGVEPSYVDADGSAQRVSDATIRQLHAVIGDPGNESGPLVVRPDRGRFELGAGDLVLEDGTTIAVERFLPSNLPFGYHRFHSTAGESRLVVVAPARCYLPARWRAWGWAAQLYAIVHRRAGGSAISVISRG